MTSVSQNVYIDKLDDIVDEYSNTYHRTIKMKPVYVKDNTYIDFQKEINDSNRKPNKIWVGKRSECYNNSSKKWLKDNKIEMYSTLNEGKSVVAERLIRT